MLKVDFDGNVAKYKVRAFVLPEIEDRTGSISGVFSEWFAGRLRETGEFRDTLAVSQRDFAMEEGQCYVDGMRFHRARDIADSAFRACLDKARGFKGTNHARIVMVIDVPTDEAFEREEPLTVSQMEALVTGLLRVRRGS